MRVERVTYFLEAVRRGSLRSAADALGITQSTLSEQITALEEDLDVLLLTRTRRGVTPTSAAEVLMPQLSALVDAEAQLRERTTSLSVDFGGIVRLGATPMVMSSLVTPTIVIVRETYPNLGYVITESDSTSMQSQVADGELDFALLTRGSAGPVPLPSVKFRPLARIAIGVHVPLHHPLYESAAVTWSDLSAWPLVSMRKGSPTWALLECNIANPHVVAQVASFPNAVVMVENGLGIAVGPQVRPVDQMTARSRWLSLAAPDAYLEICVAQREGVPLPRSARTVRDALEKYVRQSPSEMELLLK